MDVQMPGRPRTSYSNVASKDVAPILEGFFEKGEIPKYHLAGHFGEEDGRLKTGDGKRRPALLRPTDAETASQDRAPELRHHRPR